MYVNIFVCFLTTDIHRSFNMPQHVIMSKRRQCHEHFLTLFKQEILSFLKIDLLLVFYGTIFVSQIFSLSFMENTVGSYSVEHSGQQQKKH